MESSDETSSPDWNDLHRQNYADRGRRVAIVLIGISVLLFGLVAVVVAFAG